MQRRFWASLLPVFDHTEGVLTMSDIGMDTCAKIRCKYIALHAAGT